MSTELLITGMILLTLCSAFFSGSETALFSLSSMRVKAFERSQDPGEQKAAKLIRHPQDLLITILMLNVMVNILVQNIASNLFAPYSSWLLTIGIPLGLTLIFGEILPKSLALQNNTTISKFVAPTIHLAKKATTLLRFIISKLTAFLTRFLFFFLKKPPQISQEELLAVLKPSEAQGILFKDEYRLIKGYLDLQCSKVKEHMRPKEEILFYNLHDPIEKLLLLFVDEECSRLPVCDGELDNVVGIITAKNYLLHRDKITESKHIFPYLMKPFFVPEISSGHKLLQKFETSGKTMALVVDEYGQVTGLITREDLMEEVVGEIEDRRDEKSLFTRASNNVIIASGKLELADFQEIFGVELKSDHDMVSLGGWLTEKMGSIPPSGSSFNYSGLLFHILAVDPSRIKRVYIRKIDTKNLREE